MTEIKLNHNYGYHWHAANGIYVKGYLFDEENNLYADATLLTYFEGVNTQEQFNEKLLKANGFYSVIIDNDNTIYCAVDRVRSMPLFYDEGFELISDDTHNFKYSADDLDEDAVDEYLNCAYVTAQDTLMKNIKQCQAGEMLVFDKSNQLLNTQRYFEFNHNGFYKEDEDQLVEMLNENYIEVFKRTVQALKGSTAVVPLSGGYDSRLIVHMLHLLEYKNVICFSYGEKGNWESDISQKVAAHYGFKWIFVEYTKKELFDLYQDEANEYIELATNFSSFAHTQDLLAVKKLSELSMIPKESVFLPGHSGDMVAGSHIPKDIMKTDFYQFENMVDKIYEKHYKLQLVKTEFSKNNEKKLKEKIKKVIKYRESYTQEEAANELERWNWQERQAKYICNSVRVYEFYGYSWLMPLWDNEVMRFWSKIPVEQRLNRKLYFQFVKKTHKCNIPINPKVKRNLVMELYDRATDIWYARFNGNKTFFTKFFLSLKDIIDGLHIEYINNDINMYRYPKVGINVLKMFQVIEKKVNSK